MSDPTSLDTTLKSASSPISLRPEDREPPEDLAQLKTRVREDITRMLGKAVPDIAGKMIDLALNAEKEDVRFRAGKWALEEFSDRSKTPQSLPQTNVQIINAIPFERTAYIDNKPAKTVQLKNVTVALPVREIKKISPEPNTGSGKRSFGVTKAVEPSEVKVPVLPKRDG